MSKEIIDYDIVIIGSGPAGLQAALHAGRRKTSVAVLGKLKNSSLNRAHLENYCCMDNKVMGNECLSRENSRRFGPELFFTKKTFWI
jgi:thioredoxin reductase (NADPH)